MTDPGPPPDAGPTDPAGPPPLSVAQEALWYLSFLVPNQFSYNEAITIRKDGPFDGAAFRDAFNEIVRRHEAWRTTFDVVGGDPVQVLQPPPTFDLPVIDLRELTFEQAERQAVRLAAEASRVPYDLRRGPLLRPRLIRFPAGGAGDHHRLYLAMHHLVFDGVSVYRVVLPELVALYDAFCDGKESPLPEPHTRYADYARWEQQWMTEPRVGRRLEHWRRHLTPLPVLPLPLDRPRPPVPRHRGGVVPLAVPAETVGRLREVGQTVGATLFQVVASVWTLLLSRYAGQEDVVFATAADLRQQPEFESVVGYSLTPLVLRIDLGGDPTFSQLVVRVRNELLDGLDNLVPFERLVRELPRGGPANANPVYQTMFILEPPTLAPDPSWSIHQMESEIGDAVGSAKLDLELELDERPEGHLAGRLIYDLDLFDKTTAERLVGHWLRLIEAAAADPTLEAARLPLLTSEEEQRQLVEWNATTTVRTDGVVHHVVATQASRQPTAPELAAGDQLLTYGDLVASGAGVARRLRAAGVGPGDVVALGAEPSLDLVVGAFGILEAGAAGTLLDPRRPAAERHARAAAAGAVTTLDGPLLDRDEDDGSPGAAPVTPGVGPEAVCWIDTGDMDTGDGETGTSTTPLRHGAVVNLVTALAADLGLGPADTVLVLPSTLMRVPMVELWLALVAGAKLVLAPPEVADNGARLSQLIAAERVSFLHADPATWQALIDSGLKASRALGALSGGGQLGRELADQILDRSRVLWNAYGVTATTIYSTLARVERSGPVTIGRPLANTRAYVVDDRGRPTPVGVPGHLLIAGPGVADATTIATGGAAGVVDAPPGAGPAYRTGDRARWLADGQLELNPPL